MLLLATPGLPAQTKLELQANDTMRAVLEREAGKAVEVRLKSGEKLAGKVEKVGDKLVYLAQLSGAEFYDAVVDLDSVTAVVVRTR